MDIQEFLDTNINHFGVSGRAENLYVQPVLRLYRTRTHLDVLEKQSDHIDPLSFLGNYGNGPRARPPFLAFAIGSYGTGKTELSYQLSQSLQRESSHSIRALPISLGRCRADKQILDTVPSAREFAALLFKGFPQKSDVSYAMWKKIQSAIKTGGVLLVLDALDELIERPHRHSNFIKGLLGFLLGDTQLEGERNFRVLVTMRQEYLSSVDRSDAKGTLQACTVSGYQPTVYFLYVDQFSEDEIGEYLSRRHPGITRLLEFVGKVPRLLSTLQRPLLLKIFADYLEVLQTQGKLEKLLGLDGSKRDYSGNSINSIFFDSPVGPGSLIKEYVDMIHDHGRELQAAFNSEYYWNKERLARSCMELYGSGETELKRRDAEYIREPLDSEAINRYGRRPASMALDEEEDPFLSFHKCPFLIRDQDSLRFAHKTFFEFFTTQAIAEELEKKGLDKADGFNNLVVNSDMRKFLQYFLGKEEFYEYIKLSCGLMSSKGWGMPAERYEEMKSALGLTLRVLTEGMTEPEKVRDDVETRIDWFLDNCDPTKSYPGYSTYCFHAVVTYLFERPWDRKAVRWRGRLDGILKGALVHSIEKIKEKCEEREWWERLIERLLALGLRLLYSWAGELALDVESLVDESWHPKTRKRVERIIEDIQRSELRKDRGKR